MAKRKRSSASAAAARNIKDLTLPHETPIPSLKRLPSRRTKIDTNPDHNADIIDGKVALRASPDADDLGEALDVDAVNGDAATNGVAMVGQRAKSEYDVPHTNGLLEPPATKKPKKSPTKSSIAAKKGSDEIKAFKAEQAAKKSAEMKVKKEDDEDEWDKRADPDGDEDAPAEDIDTLKAEARRPPPVHSEYLPLPWKGRLGYACLNTYLRFSNPPIFTSRTCRIASILEHRHPLKDPSQPEHTTKNRPDKTQPASIERGQRYVEELCLANVRDLPKMLRWNDKYGIKFMRLSSEMFPFASHAEYGYKLAPFASEALAEVGRVVAELGHRVSTHPGQFTQLGSPRKEVIENAIRDLDYHDEMLSLLKLPEQADRDAVMILHLGGTFGDKAATLDRFRENYKGLSPSVKQRVVLENDDVSWSVHDLLPFCEELNIPLCLDFHHHNIIFDSTQLREGTHDIRPLFPRIKATWTRKRITQKMHYSEPTPEAVTGRQRRKHNPRPSTLPPCADDMDLMIEAKDKEQAVFELMRTFKLPGWDSFNDIVPYERDDDNKPVPRKVKKKKNKKQVKDEIEEFGRELSDEEELPKAPIPDEEIGMGGSENRVYWPPGMEEWLRPKKREMKRKSGAEDDDAMFANPTPANFAARKKVTERNRRPLGEDVRERLREAGSLEEVFKVVEDIRAFARADGDVCDEDEGALKGTKVGKTPVKKTTAVKPKSKAKGMVKTNGSTLSKTAKGIGKDEDEDEDDDDDDLSLPDLSASDEGGEITPVMPVTPMRKSRRKSKVKASYAEGGDDEAED